MCDCHEKISKMLVEKVKEKVSQEIGFQQITSSGFVNEPYLVLDKLLNPRKVIPVYLPFEVEYTRIAKSSGKIRKYKTTVNYFPTHCPMCGEKYDG